MGNGISSSADKRRRNLVDSLSEDPRRRIDENIYLSQVLREVYPENYQEIELFILSVSNYRHREISEALNISRLGVTRRIKKAREILQEKLLQDMYFL